MHSIQGGFMGPRVPVNLAMICSSLGSKSGHECWEKEKRELSG